MKSLYQSIASQIGVTDEVNECDCCGRENLKKTVVFETKQEFQADGVNQYIFLGTSCAKIAMAASFGKKYKYRTRPVTQEYLAEQQAEALKGRIYNAYIDFKISEGFTRYVATVITSDHIKQHGYDGLANTLTELGLTY